MKKIILPILLVAGGVFIGWYGLINFQLYAKINQLEKTSAAQTDELTKIEDYLKKTFGGGA